MATSSRGRCSHPFLTRVYIPRCSRYIYIYIIYIISPIRPDFRKNRKKTPCASHALVCHGVHPKAFNERLCCSLIPVLDYSSAVVLPRVLDEAERHIYLAVRYGKKCDPPPSRRVWPHCGMSPLCFWRAQHALSQRGKVVHVTKKKIPRQARLLMAIFERPRQGAGTLKPSTKKN